MGGDHQARADPSLFRGEQGLGTQVWQASSVAEIEAFISEWRLCTVCKLLFLLTLLRRTWPIGVCILVLSARCLLCKNFLPLPLDRRLLWWHCPVRTSPCYDLSCAVPLDTTLPGGASCNGCVTLLCNIPKQLALASFLDGI